MIRIGLVDLDTSHPAAFTAILRSFPDVDVTALWDAREVWPEGYARTFAQKHDIPNVCTHLEEMHDHVDAVMILGVNWDAHLRKAEVFMKEKIPVLIDKPVVGNARDCVSLLDLQAKYGSLVFGGSSLRYADEVTALRHSIGDRSHCVSAAAAGPGDFFSYGIHATEMLQGGVGCGIVSVDLITDGEFPVFALAFRDGFVSFLHLQMHFYEWSLAVHTDQGLRTATVNPDALYRPFLRTFVALLRGEPADYSLEGPVEAVRVHIAAQIARRTHTRVVLNELHSSDGFDGAVFAHDYAETKRKQNIQAG
jgi:hypothetical protein